MKVNFKFNGIEMVQDMKEHIEFLQMLYSSFSRDSFGGNWDAWSKEHITDVKYIAC